LGNGPLFHVFLANFLLQMHRNGQNSTSGQIFKPKYEIMHSQTGRLPMIVLCPSWETCSLNLSCTCSLLTLASLCLT